MMISRSNLLALHHLVLCFCTGKFITKLSGRLFRGNPLGEPWGIAVSYDGKIFVSDWDKSCIHTYNENGNYTGNFGSADVNSPLKYPTGIAIDKRGRIIIADRGNHVVWIFTPDGSLLSQFGKMGHAPGDLYFPFGVAVNKEGNIIIHFRKREPSNLCL